MGKRKQESGEYTLDEMVHQINGLLSVKQSGDVNSCVVLSAGMTHTPAMGPLFLLANDHELLWMGFGSSDLPRNVAHFLKSHRRVILESTFKPADPSQTSPFRVRNYFSPPMGIRPFCLLTFNKNEISKFF
jgi:hypothetical protein